MAEKAPNTFTIFYCWISDHKSSHNRALIRDALDVVCDSLNTDDSLQYLINVDQDTKREPGLCDIPAVILRKIAAADAVVVDITFVAEGFGNRIGGEPPEEADGTAPPTGAQDQTEPETSAGGADEVPAEVEVVVKQPTGARRLVSNPNILFELGYAFHALGPDRIVTVMNTKYGHAEELAFDFRHRRFPIAYEFPAPDGSKRGTVVKSFAKLLEDRVRTIVDSCGPRMVGSTGDEHAKDAAEIQALWNSYAGQKADLPLLVLQLHPQNYQERRWADFSILEEVLSRNQFVNGRHEFPPSTTNTATVAQGLFNCTYGDPDWALTYAGQYWSIGRLTHYGDYEIDAFDRMTPGRYDIEDMLKLEAGTFLDFDFCLELLCNNLFFCSLLAREYHATEKLTLSLRFENLSEKRFTFHRSRAWPCSMPCLASTLPLRRSNTASELRASWKDHCAEYLFELIGLFDMHGKRFTRESLRKVVEERHPG